MDKVVLNNGSIMPLLGFGIMSLFDKDECAKVLKDASDTGYRLFDCAQIYGKEDAVGYALKQAKIPREEIFLTTKVLFTNYEGEDVRKSIIECMEKLKTSYFDLVIDPLALWKCISCLS